jgi:hypothetical protein
LVVPKTEGKEDENPSSQHSQINVRKLSIKSKRWMTK